MPVKEKIIEKEYHSRINRTFDYIEKHIDHAFTLAELADVANFSKYHFHRIFQALVGETPFQFIQRVRLEKAAYQMVAHPDESITEIAERVGFSDLSVFSRNFKSYFGQTASDYRKTKVEKSNQRQTQSKEQQADTQPAMYFCSSSQTLKWRTNMELNKSVEVQELPDMTVAYVRHIGSYKGNEALFEGLWNRLFAWAGPRGLLGGSDFKAIAMYHDDPNVTAEDKLRTSVCITVPADTKVDGEIGKLNIDGGKYVVARFEVNKDQFQSAWSWVYGQWLPNSGYQPDDKPCFELYPEEPKDGKFVVDICVPVKPL